MRILTPDELRLTPMWHEAGYVVAYLAYHRQFPVTGSGGCTNP